ncbi:MAG TPA: hypothetical protein VKI44_33770 [Acetobacteraceae bacterium]|nr:hypothetical protein [Acetobacteraceae bacterium]
MNLRFTPDQLAFRDEVRTIIRNNLPMSIGSSGSSGPARCPVGWSRYRFYYTFNECPCRGMGNMGPRTTSICERRWRAGGLAAAC